MAVAENTQRQLDWEARLRPRAAIAAALAAVLGIAGQVWSGLALNGAPQPGLLESLANLQAAGPIGTRQSVQIPFAHFYLGHFTQVLLATIVVALGSIGFAYCLTFLGATTRARRPELPRISLYLPAVGGVVLGVAYVADSIGRHQLYTDVLAGHPTVDEVHDLGTGGIGLVAQVLILPGSLALAAGCLLISINAMRAGLLTRFMGILGAIAGGLVLIQFVVPVGPFPLVQTAWLIGLSMLLIGQRRGGELPAWETGKAVPWPTQAEVAKQRRAKADGSSRPEPTPPPPPQPVATGAPKRKRKRRK
jgi:hypothetical protein